ncbi:MAG: 50S ribosomal protein L20 [Patescibacteria group bacterium]|nr:50S ribosomal protein L20 [Patescibacteria group bacterium]
MRVKTGTTSKQRHKKLLKGTKGMRDMRSRSVRRAKEATLKSGANAYIGRKNKKRDFRSLWNTRINAAAREHGLSYSRFISGLKKNKIELDRKVLAEIAAEKPEVFAEIAKKAKSENS